MGLKGKKTAKKLAEKLGKSVESKKAKAAPVEEEKVEEADDQPFDDEFELKEAPSGSFADKGGKRAKADVRDPEDMEKSLDKFLQDLEGEDDEEEPTLEGEEEEAEGAAGKVGEKRKRDTSKEITNERIKKWTAEALAGNQVSFKALLKAFRAAAHAGDDEEDNSLPDVVIPTPALVNTVMITCLKNMDRIFDKLLGLDPVDLASPTPGPLPDKAKNYNKHYRLIRLFFRDVVHVFSMLTDAPMISFTLTHFERLIRYLVASPNYAKKILHSLLGYFAHEDEAVRFRAFMCIRRIAITLPADPFLHLCLKGAYLTYVRHSRFYKRSTAEATQFMCNGVVELYGLQPALSFEHAFVYIRQLALTLRSYFLKRTLVDQVVSWQFINSIRMWTALLATYPNEPEFKSLSYPMTQIIMGLAEDAPGTTAFPLRFICIELLQSLAKNSGIVVSTLFLILDAFMSKPMRRTHRKYSGTDSPMDYSFLLKVSDKSIRGKSFRLALLRDAMYYLLEFFTISAHSISFPELYAPARITLKRFHKEHTDVRSDQAIRALVDKLDKHAQLVREERSKADFCPKDMDKVKAFEDALRTKLQMDFSLVPPQEGGAKAKPLMATSPSPLVQFYYTETMKRRHEAAQRAVEAASGKDEKKEDEEDAGSDDE